MHLIRLIVEFLDGLGVEHPHQEIEGDIVAVRDDAEDGLLALPQLLQFHVIGGGDPLDFRQSERGKTDRGGNEDAHGRFAGGLLEYPVLPQSDVIGVFLGQPLKEQVQGGIGSPRPPPWPRRTPAWSASSPWSVPPAGPHGAGTA